MAIDTIVTISPKFQVVIPKSLRERLKLKPGEKLQMFEVDGRIEIIRHERPKDLKGFLPEIDTKIQREPDQI